MRRLPPLASLRAFEAAARHSSFQAAAAELGVTPTAISHQVKLLEQHCGHALFRRQPRPVTLTDAGASLYPVIRDGLDNFASAIAAVRHEEAPRPVRLTTTNAFASKWLVPRLAEWRREWPEFPLEVIGTDTVLDLRKEEADLAIRYMRAAPADFVSHEIFRDCFVAVCHPDLLAQGESIRSLSELSGQTLIHCYWPPSDTTAPTWQRFLDAAAKHYHEVPTLKKVEHLSFREELHGIDAACNGQGVIVVSDLLVARELADGILVKALNFTMPGYGFYLTYLSDSPYQDFAEAFVVWAREVA